MKKRNLTPLIALVVLALAAPGAATAKTCKGTLKAKGRSNTEASATKSAIALWSNNAKRKYGASYAIWSKADNANVNCVTTSKKSQKPLCIASGKPCSD